MWDHPVESWGYTGLDRVSAIPGATWVTAVGLDLHIPVTQTWTQGVCLALTVSSRPLTALKAHERPPGPQGQAGYGGLKCGRGGMIVICQGSPWA